MENKKEFLSVFQITKMITFEVKYYTLCDNKNPHFTMTAWKFVKNKMDYSEGGCGCTVLPASKAYQFFKKWEDKHLSDLSQKEYNEMINDLETLKDKYNYIIQELNEKNKPYNPNICFNDIVELSKTDLKNN